MQNDNRIISKKYESNPLVSIGIPVFNGMSKRNNYSINIYKSLNSILNQSYKNLEIIISDNCSSDDTPNIIDQISKNDSRVKFYRHSKPLGAGENFTFVLSKATGKYFKWNCHDDFISEDFIEKNLVFLEENKNFAFCSSPTCYDFDVKEKKNILKFDFGDSLFKKIKEFHRYRSVCLSMVYGLIRREKLLKTTEFSKDYLAIDWIVVIELLFEGNLKL